MSADLVRFGRAVRDVRRDRNLSQQQLGDMVGVTNVAISQIETARTAPALAKVSEIADALSVSIAMLFGDPLAVAEHIAAQIRPQIRVLGYDLALIPREDAP